MGLPPVSCGPYTFEVRAYRRPPDERLTLCSYALVQPVPGRSQLQLSEQGLQILREVAGPVAPIVVIGPYRSGKIFLLNQLLGVKCSKCILMLAGLQQYLARLQCLMSACFCRCWFWGGTHSGDRDKGDLRDLGPVSNFE